MEKSGQGTGARGPPRKPGEDRSPTARERAEGVRVDYRGPGERGLEAQRVHCRGCGGKKRERKGGMVGSCF